MNNWKIAAGLLLASGTLVASMGTVSAAGLSKVFANRAFYCEGGNETSGRNYQFRSRASDIVRMDYRFPQQGVVFQLGEANKGNLGNSWSYETLSETSKGRVHLYERVSLRAPSQTKHIYRTYELFARGNHLFLILYDGVTGARDWKMKTTRPCGELVGNKIVQGKKPSYWSTSFTRN